MARVFNGKVEAEIREDSYPARNLCLSGLYRLPACRSARSRSIAATCLGRLAWVQASASRRRSCYGATTFIQSSRVPMMEMARPNGITK